jgi:preprotein translocase subunit SecY
MFSFLRQLWHTDDLRRRILITAGILVVYRILAHLPVPGTDPLVLQTYLSQSNAGGVLGVFSALTGGSLSNFSIVLLGLGPYINASIIIQLCTVIFPKLEALSKEGQQGQQQLNRYTRWLSVPLAFIQSYGFLLLINQSGLKMVDSGFPQILLPMLFVTAGSVFLMWLGEMITEKGIGNGISMLIFVGIVASVPTNLYGLILSQTGQVGMVILFGLLSVALLIAVVLFTDAHRLIPLTYANQGAGRGVQGGLPIRLNQAGMVPIIFSVSLITLPAIVAQFLQTAPRFSGVVTFINTYLNSQNPTWLYIFLYFLLTIAFTYFYVSVTFKPADLAENIQKRGGFIPGIRPGAQTAAMLTKVSNGLNLWGGTFLGLLAVLPLIVGKFLPTAGGGSMLASGSALIIVVGVVMELIRQVNAQMLAHDYDKLV